MIDLIKSLFRKPWFFPALVCFLFGSSIGGVGGYKAFTWIAYDAAFCTSCHVHDYAQYSWMASVHNQSNTTCHDCHHQSLLDNMNNAYVLVTTQLGLFSSEKGGHDNSSEDMDKDMHEEMLGHLPAVTDKICLKCHAAETEGIFIDIVGPLGTDAWKNIPKVDTNAMHKIHLSVKSLDPSEEISWQANTNFPSAKNGVKASSSNSNDGQHTSPVPDHFFEKDKHHDKFLVHCRYCHGGEANRSHSFQATDSNCKLCHQSIDAAHASHEGSCLQCHGTAFLVEGKSNISSDSKEIQEAER